MTAQASIDVATFERGEDDECAACGTRPDVLHASGEAMCALLCEGCMTKARAEHERRCSFCGITEAWIAQARALGSGRRDPDWRDVGGRPVCGAECARLHRLRLDAVPLEDVAIEFEVPSPGDGWRVIEPWWLVSDSAYVMLEIDVVVGAGWYVMPRGGGVRGPMADWREAVG